MSGVGEALAVLSLVIAVAENYKSVCSQPLGRFRKFSSEVARYLSHLENQSVIYETQCQRLWDCAVPEARAMLTCPGDARWQSEQIESNLSIYLGENTRRACRNTLEQIKILLEDSVDETDRLTVALERDILPKPLGAHERREWRRHVKEKLKFAYSESRLQKHLDQLTVFNIELKSLIPNGLSQPLVSQANKVNESSLGPYIEKLEAFQINAKASQEAFRTLHNVCTKHDEHRVSLCVYDDAKTHVLTPAPQFEFDMVFTGAETHTDTKWYEIRMKISKIDGQEKSSGASAQTSARPNPPYPLDDFATRMSTSRTMSTVPVDLCVCLHNWYWGKSRQDTALYTSNDDRWQKSILPIRTIECSETNPISLQQLINGLSPQTNTRVFSDYQKLRLARILALGFLRLHATNWSTPAWRSNDVLFFEPCRQVEHGPIHLPSPHVNTCILNWQKTYVQELAPPCHGDFVRNEQLYRLGILLLEIAWLQQWEDLRQRYIPRTGITESSEEIFQARRLAEDPLSGMPGQYNDIVGKLIDCDFAQGRDLQKIELQAAVYQHVIDPLQKLEEAFEKFEI